MSLMHSFKLSTKFLLVPLLCSCLLSGQENKPAPSSTTTTQAPAPQNEPQKDAIDSAHGKEPPARISPKEAEDLFKSVDEIMRFVSKDTGLPLHHEIKKELIGRDAVQKYVEEKMAEDEDQKSMERSEVVLKKFGLLPREFHLRSFLIQLLREQIAAFYDSKKKTVFMLNWLTIESQKPIMAHELTHALQDQTIDLEKWMDDARKDTKRSTDPDNAEMDVDEESSARSAVAEGQGMAVMIDYSLAESGKTIKDFPRLVDMYIERMNIDDGAPLLASAPLLLRESLMFPYRDGLRFVDAVLMAGGVDRAFTALLYEPPQSTHEVLMPQSYLRGEHMGAIRLPNVGKTLGKGFKQYDVGSIGQFDMVIMLKQFVGEKVARELSPEWRGGIYYSASKSTVNGKKVDKDTVIDSTADVSLLYVSKWSSDETAKRFAGIYTNTLKTKYSSLTPDTDEPGVFNSNEGRVQVEVHGDQVFVMEGFDATTGAKLRTQILNTKEGDKGRSIAGNLSLRTMKPVYGLMHNSTWLSSF